jgi:dipeptidyl aminopeptidase/acylaminoacyl peptidase
MLARPKKTGTKPAGSRRFAGLVAVCVLAGVALALTVPSAQASYPGVNARIAFSRCEDGANCAVGKIWTMNPDGSGQARLFSDTGYWDDDPSYSADGHRIAFQRCSEGIFDCGIATADAHGHGIKQLTPGSHPIGDDYPVFSPDGSRIVFSHYESGPKLAEIWVMGADGSNPHALTTGPAWNSSPEFSPDGTKIVFHHMLSDVQHIWLMNADGSNQHALTSDVNRRDRAPSFSPDGSQVAFQGQELAVGGKWAIWVVGVNGAGAHQLTTPPIGDREPKFSPDGKRLVFERDLPDNTTRLFTQAFAGGGATQLTSGNDWHANWGQVATPSIDSPPTIAGVARAGHALTATAGAAGWGGTAGFQWLRCAATCSAISGAISATYKPTNADVGKELKVRQTQTSAGGSVSALSAASGPVAAEPGASIARSLTRTRTGRLLARLTCPVTQSVVCRGTLTLTTPPAHGHTVRVGSVSFKLAAGTSAKVTLRVSKRGQALMAKSRSLRLKAALSTSDDAGNRAQKKSTVTLKRASRGHH